jgi:hypothetical protein
MVVKGIPIEIGTQIEYIKGKKNWIIASNAKATDINKKYYEKVIEKLCIALGFKIEFESRNNTVLTEWL